MMFVLRTLRRCSRSQGCTARQQRKERVQRFRHPRLMSCCHRFLVVPRDGRWRYSRRHCCFSSDRRWEVALAHLCKQCSEHPVRSQVRLQSTLKNSTFSHLTADYIALLSKRTMREDLSRDDHWSTEARTVQ